MRLEVNALHPEPRKIARAIEVLGKGEIIAYPTDTVYGIGCAMGQKRAIERIYQITGKDEHQLLTLLCSDLSDIARYAVIGNPQYRLLKRLLPGAYTFVLPATKEVPRMLLSKRKTIGIRVPAHAVPIALTAALGVPLITTSASYRGEEPLGDPAEIAERFKSIPLVLDAGYGGSVPSTVVDLTSGDPEVLRVGAGAVDLLT